MVIRAQGIIITGEKRKTHVDRVNASWRRRRWYRKKKITTGPERALPILFPGSVGAPPPRNCRIILNTTHLLEVARSSGPVANRRFWSSERSCCSPSADRTGSVGRRLEVVPRKIRRNVWATFGGHLNQPRSCRLCSKFTFDFVTAVPLKFARLRDVKEEKTESWDLAESARAVFLCLLFISQR